MAVNATAIWRVRPSGSNTNGGGYDPGISGAATDYSQQNAAQASGSHGTATGTTTFTDTVAANFTSAMVGNALWIASGAGFTVGAYFIITFNSSTSVVLDRSPGTGTVAVWALGGGWATPGGNTASTGPIVPGNIVYILGSGTPNPSSYTFDYTDSSGGVTPASGSSTAGCVIFANDPATPGYKAPPDTTGGMPVIKFAGTLWGGASYVTIKGLWFVNSTTGNGFNNQLTNCAVFGCVQDTNNNGSNVMVISSYTGIYASEFFNSNGTPGGGYGLLFNSVYIAVIGCNVHDLSLGSPAFAFGQGSTVLNNIISKCSNVGLAISGPYCVVANNTIDGNTGNGIELSAQNAANNAIYNNIISNHTGAGKYGLIVDSGTAFQNSQLSSLVDYNVYYNNTANYNAISAGPHDTALGSNPYVGQSTENYSLA